MVLERITNTSYKAYALVGFVGVVNVLIALFWAKFKLDPKLTVGVPGAIGLAGSVVFALTKLVVGGCKKIELGSPKEKNPLRPSEVPPLVLRDAPAPVEDKRSELSDGEETVDLDYSTDDESELRTPKGEPQQQFGGF